MQKDSLRRLLEQIEQRCQEKGIAVFYGAIEAGLQPTVSWNQTSEVDWEQYLNLLDHCGSKLLIVTSDQNEVDTTDSYLWDYLNDLPQEPQKDFRKAVQEVEKTSGQLASFTLTFFHGSIPFELQKTAPWYEAYLTVNEAYEADEEDDLAPSRESLSPEEIDQWARKIIHHSTYLLANNRMQRNRAATEFCDREGIDHSADTFKILRRAELLFEEEVQPQREQELSQKVKELKDKGLKKVEVQTKQGISAGTLNRHWY